MQRRRTATSLAEKRLHRLEHFRQDRRGRLMIKKNAAHERSAIGSRMFASVYHSTRAFVSLQVIPARTRPASFAEAIAV